ncbi:EamA family transporter [Candidatus Woesearchaeota archaeon]|nr:EamA family transporter [Candidatus Woesearchaeota archaeon]
MNGYLKIVIATSLFSLMSPLVKLLELDSLSILWAITVIAFLSLGILFAFQGKLKEALTAREKWQMLLLLGVFTTINNILFLYAVKTTTIANAVLTHFLAPVFVVLLADITLKEGITRKDLLALALSFSGLAILIASNEMSLSNIHIVGLLAGTASAVFFAGEILSKKFLTKHHASGFVVFRYLLIPVVVLAPFTSFGGMKELSLLGMASLLIIGIVVIAFGNTLFQSGLRDVKAKKASIINYIEPLGAILWGILFFKEALTWETIIGGFLILFGTYLVIKKQ